MTFRKTLSDRTSTGDPLEVLLHELATTGHLWAERSGTRDYLCKCRDKEQATARVALMESVDMWPEGHDALFIYNGTEYTMTDTGAWEVTHEPVRHK